MEKSSNAWRNYYSSEVNVKPFIIESFVARTFLSKRPITLLKDYDFNNKIILDMGCGNGRHISFFEHLGFKVIATEISNEKVLSLQKVFPNSKVIYSKSHKIELPDCFCNYVAAINSIYYLESRDAHIENNIEEITRVLKPGGAGIISFVGKDHFILQGSKIINDKNACIIDSEDHQCDRDVLIRPVYSKEDINSLFESQKNIMVYNIGEIRDILNEKIRHLYYVIIYKEK